MKIRIAKDASRNPVTVNVNGKERTYYAGNEYDVSPEEYGILKAYCPEIGFAQETEISTADGSVTIVKGEHDGSEVVKLKADAVENLAAENIKKDVVILGVTGTYEGEETEE